MRVEVTPTQVEVTPGQPVVLSVVITNTTTLIAGYTLRILGADPSWVSVQDQKLSLFPDEVRAVPVIISLPAGLPAGTRQIAVQIRELTPPEHLSIVDVGLTVPAARAVLVRADPVIVTAGRQATFNVVAENTGNTMIVGRLAGDDPEAKVEFLFDPEVVHLAPGDHAVVEMQARSRRPLTGSPVIRPLSLYVDDVESSIFDTPVDTVVIEQDGPAPARDAKTAVASATFVQKSLLSRGAFSLLGLLVAVTVFALVITLALSKLVGQSTADRNLALQVAAARDGSGAAAGTSTLSGVVTQLSTQTGLSAVSVSVFDPANTSQPLATTATDGQGAWSVPQLAAGKYKISFQRAGFVQTWYPLATDPTDATAVAVKAGQQLQGLNVGLGGQPASITGTVTGADVSAAVLYLETVPGRTNQVHTAADTTTPITATGTSSAGPAVPAAVPTDPLVGGGAIVQKTAIGADGTFTLTNVPSPNVYRLVVVKPGYATASEELDVAGGESRTGVQIALRHGDGSISGTVSSQNTALGKVSITATSGTSSVTTVSLTQPGKVGTFTLSGLPTPGSFTVTASLDGYASQTQTLTLASGQKLKGLRISLGSSAGSLTGTVSEIVHSSPTDKVGHSVPASGVTVTASNGLLTVQSQTGSTRGDTGQWSISGLPLPGTYTLTFSRPDLASQTVSASLGASGQLVGAPLQITMQSATTSIAGQVTQNCQPSQGCSAPQPLGEALVTLTSSTNTYTVRSASGPKGSVGTYEIAGVVPGTYTLSVTPGSGVAAFSRVITLVAGKPYPQPVTLNAPAGVHGTVTLNGKPVPAGWTVFLYQAAQYPYTVERTTLTRSMPAPQSAADRSDTGYYSFTGLDAGDYIVAAGPSADPTSAMQTAPFRITPNKSDQSVDIEVSQ